MSTRVERVGKMVRYTVLKTRLKGKALPVDSVLVDAADKAERKKQLVALLDKHKSPGKVGG